MPFAYALAVGSLLVTLAENCSAEERVESGWLRGFTKSPTEHIIYEPDKPSGYESGSGVVLDPSGAGMDGVIAELGEIRGIKINHRGAFKLGEP